MITDVDTGEKLLYVTNVVVNLAVGEIATAVLTCQLCGFDIQTEAEFARRRHRPHGKYNFSEAKWEW